MALTPEQFFGKIGVKNGIFTEEQLQDCFREQRERFRKTGQKTPLSYLLFDHKLVNQEQCRDLLQEFKYSCLRRDDKEMADIAVEKGLLTRKEIDQALKFQRKLFRGGVGIFQLGEILISRGIMAPEKVFDLHVELWRRRNPNRPIPRMAGQPPGVPAQPTEQTGAATVAEHAAQAKGATPGFKVCPACGYQNPQVATMCYGCGESLSAPPKDIREPSRSKKEKSSGSDTEVTI